MLVMSLLSYPSGEGSRGEWRWATRNCFWAAKGVNGVSTKKCLPAAFKQNFTHSHQWGTGAQLPSSLCPLSSQGKSKRVFFCQLRSQGMFEQRSNWWKRKSFLDACQGYNWGDMRNWEKPRLFFISHEEIEKLSSQISVGRIKRKLRCLFAEGNGRSSAAAAVSLSECRTSTGPIGLRWLSSCCP